MAEGVRGVFTLIKGRSEGVKWNENHSITHTIPTAAAMAIAVSVGVLIRPHGELVVVACWWLFVI
jgi:hypothetical protein